MDTDILLINGVILPFFTTCFFPLALRDQDTGRIKGFLQKDFYITFVVWLVLETFVLVNKYGLDPQSFRFKTPLPDAIDLLIANTVVVIVCATLFVKGTHRKLYGTTIKFTRWW